jgi:hypothetical protein
MLGVNVIYSVGQWREINRKLDGLETMMRGLKLERGVGRMGREERVIREGERGREGEF